MGSMMSISQPCARACAAATRGGGGLAAAGAGRDEQVRFLVFQVGDPFPAAGQGGQVDAVRGLGVAVEQGAGGRGGRVPPGRGVRPEGAGEVAAEVAADDLVDVLLLGGIGVPRGRVGQRDHGVRAGGEAARDIQPAGGVRGGVGAEVAAQLEVDRADHRPHVPRPPPAGGQRRPGRHRQAAEHGGGDQRPGVQADRGRDGGPPDGGALPAGQPGPPAGLAGGEPAGHPADRVRAARQERRVGAPPAQRRAGGEPHRQHHRPPGRARQAQRDRAAPARAEQPARVGGAAERPPGQQPHRGPECGQHDGR